MPDPNVEPCPTCNRPVGVHTIDELAQHLSQVYDHVLPYEEMAEPQQATITVCGSVAVKAAAHSSAMGHYPVLVFEFTTPEGPLPPLALLLDELHMREVRTLIGQSIDAAIQAARKARR